jgi:ADYC domain
MIKLRDTLGNKPLVRLPVEVTFHGEHFPPPYIYSVESVRGDKSKLVVRYRKKKLTPSGATPSTIGATPTSSTLGAMPASSVASDEQLPEISFRFNIKAPLIAGGPALEGIDEGLEYTLRFARRQPKAGNASPEAPERYAAGYKMKSVRTGQESGEIKVCAENGHPELPPLNASFLEGREVDDRSAKVTRNPKAVTISCTSGAIDTCLTWGYAPWAPRAGQEGDALFGACLQAKRAAYFVGRGELGSFTIPGTPIYLKDRFGIHNDTINDASLEAIWSSQGADCFTWGHRRREEVTPPKGSEYNPAVPGCQNSNGALLATGRTNGATAPTTD